MNTIRLCPNCAAPLPPDAPQGLCPECLLKSDPDVKPAAEGATPSRPPTPPSVSEIAQHFPQLEILEIIGQGGMGIVYKARQPKLDRMVALKILPEEAGRDAAFAERFAREARTLAKLNHPGIVAIYDFGHAGPFYYLVMEFVDGVNLRQMIQAQQIKPAEALGLVMQICEALQFAHDQGVVHRDIKPGNILANRSGRVKIADFGLAKLLGQSAPDFSLTGSQHVMGTPHYMAPEQASHPLQVDHRADIYSLGVVFYEMLTGDLPMGRFALPSQKVQVDVRLDEIVLHTLEREPDRRYQHASTVRTDLESISRSPTLTPNVARAGAIKHGQMPGERFATRMMPRDLTDILVPLVLTPIIIGLLVALPAWVVSVVFNTSIALPGLIIACIFLVLMTLLGLGSVQSITVDAGGLTIHRNIGPSRFLPWSSIVQIQAMPRADAIRQVMGWPGWPPRGSILGMSSLHFYRISCLDDCWHFGPREPEKFLEAVSRWQRSATDAAMPPPSDKTPAVESVDQSKRSKPQAAPVVSPPPAAPNEPTPAEAVKAAGWAIIQGPSDALLLAGSVALLTALLVGTWLWSADRNLADMARMNLIGMSVVQGVYGLFVVIAGLLMRGWQFRLFTLLCVVIFGLFLPAMVALNVILELKHIPQWPAVMPMWLGMPVALWATIVLFRRETREAFKAAGARTVTPPADTVPHESAIEPRLSRLALVGAILVPPALTLVSYAIFVFLVYRSKPVIELIEFTCGTFGVAALFGTTILGGIAIGHIKRSNGQMCGLPLAVADLLFFPLLVVGVLLFLSPPRGISPAAHAFFALIACSSIARAVWRAIDKSVGGARTTRLRFRDLPPEVKGPARKRMWAAAGIYFMCVGLGFLLLPLAGFNQRSETRIQPLSHAYKQVALNIGPFYDSISLLGARSHRQSDSMPLRIEIEANDSTRHAMTVDLPSLRAHFENGLTPVFDREELMRWMQSSLKIDTTAPDVQAEAGEITSLVKRYDFRTPTTPEEFNLALGAFKNFSVVQWAYTGGAGGMTAAFFAWLLVTSVIYGVLSSRIKRAALQRGRELLTTGAAAAAPTPTRTQKPG